MPNQKKKTSFAPTVLIIFAVTAVFAIVVLAMVSLRYQETTHTATLNVVNGQKIFEDKPNRLTLIYPDSWSEDFNSFDPLPDFELYPTHLKLYPTNSKLDGEIEVIVAITTARGLEGFRKSSEEMIQGKDGRQWYTTYSTGLDNEKWSRQKGKKVISTGTNLPEIEKELLVSAFYDEKYDDLFRDSFRTVIQNLSIN